MAGSTPASLSAEAAPQAPVAPLAAAARKPPASPWFEAWRRFRRHRIAVVCVFILTAMMLAITIGPALWGVAINDIDFSSKLEGPSWHHPFGTDDLGQDLLARMLYGGRISLAVGLAAMSVAILLGTLIGALAGMSRGSIDAALMWLTDLFLSLPQLPLLLLVIYLFRDALKAMFGVEGGIFIMIVVVIGGLRWMPVARLVRAQILSDPREGVRGGRARARRLQDAPGGPPHPAQCAGPGDRGRHDRRRRRHHRRIDALLPGIGLPARHSDLGRVLFDAKDYLDIAPHWALFPGAAIFLAVLAINFIGDGLRDALDPRRVL